LFIETIRLSSDGDAIGERGESADGERHDGGGDGEFGDSDGESRGERGEAPNDEEAPCTGGSTVDGFSLPGIRAESAAKNASRRPLPGGRRAGTLDGAIASRPASTKVFHVLRFAGAASRGQVRGESGPELFPLSADAPSLAASKEPGCLRPKELSRDVLGELSSACLLALCAWVKEWSGET